jgi:hypothetical protein
LKKIVNPATILDLKGENMKNTPLSSIKVSDKTFAKIQLAVEKSGMDRADVIRWAISLGLDSMRKINYDVETAVAKTIDVIEALEASHLPQANITALPKRPHLHAAAGPPLLSEVMDWDGDNDTVHVKINGLSMSPKLNDGDVIAMRHKKASRNPFMKKGLIYLVEYDGGFTVKRYNTRPARAEEKGEDWVENGKVKVLESLNPAYPEIIVKDALEWVAWLDV